MTQTIDLKGSWGGGSGTEPDLTPVEPVSLAMVVDVSNSITDADYRIQREGTGIALKNVTPDIVAMAESGTPVIASYTEFSGEAVVRIEPTLLQSAEDIEAFAAKVAGMERLDIEGETLPSEALKTTTALHAQVEEQYGPLYRKITDISADGYGSQPKGHTQDQLYTESERPEVEALQEQRDIAMRNGIEVNGIIMPDADVDFDRALRSGDGLAEELVDNDDVQEREHYTDNLTDEELEKFQAERPEYFEGPDSSAAINERFYWENGVTGFTMRANSAEEYGETLERKLRLELSENNIVDPENRMSPDAAPVLGRSG